MKFDLHIHSKYSDDSKIELHDIVKVAEKRGMDGLALMDHNSIEGYKKIKEIDTELVIVPGIELSTEEGHVGALGIEEDVGRPDTVKDAIELIHEKDGVAIAVHPYRYWSGIGEDVVMNNEGWDAVEGMNGRTWHYKNLKSVKLAERMDLPLIGGSDSHRLKTVGKAYTIVEGVDEWEDIIEQIRKGKTDIGGENRTYKQTFFYVRRALGGYVKRGFKRI